MYNMHKKYEEKILRVESEASSKFKKKAFFDAWNWLLALSAYVFLKSENNGFVALR